MNGPINKKPTKKQVYDMLDGHCAYCGKKIEFDELDIDHKVPQSKGGKDSIGNLFPSCSFCNRCKNDRDIEEFRKYLSEGLSDVLNENREYRLALRYSVVKTDFKPVKFYFEKVKEESQKPEAPVQKSKRTVKKKSEVPPVEQDEDEFPF